MATHPTVKLSPAAVRQLRAALDLIDLPEEDDVRPEPTAKAYSPAERRTVRRRKQATYGTDEVYAVPALASYPLTKGKKPNRERVQAAWDYIHVAKNREKLGPKEAAKATARIRAFARKHFPDMQLADTTQKSLGVDEVYVFPVERLWPLTEHRHPSPERIQKAWQEIHSAIWEARLSDRDMARAETRLTLFAAAHGIPLQTRRVPRTVVL